ncbi:MAG: acyltransferase [Clostridia bacterium]|nr:acyltransferase [Clostridia bacterium]
MADSDICEISGRFFLDPERNMPFQKILKSIKRIIIAFVFWDIVYQVFYLLSGTYDRMNWKGILTQAISGPYHFWYLLMIVCMYAITPFLRKITENKRLMEYFIILFFLFELLNGYGTELPVIGSTIAEILTKTNFHFALGYSGYYILGYYIYKYSIPKRFEGLLYGLAVVLIVAASVATIRQSLIEGANNEWYTEYLKPNIIIVATAIYTVFMKRISKHQFSEVMIKWVTRLSEYSFGIYLIHALVIELMGLAGLTPVMVNAFVMHPVIVLLAFAISSIMVWLLRMIPCVGKKIT